jgi:nucleoid DNA-binding protein
MAKALSKSQIVASLAETVGLTKKQAVQTLEALVALAYKVTGRRNRVGRAAWRVVARGERTG